MIGWLNSAALGALGLLAVPILIHLLRSHRAERVLFPSLRFVDPSRTAAVRFRLPTDPVLLAVRLGIVTAAALAAAQPVIVTAGRLRNWNGRIVRAVIVDTSAGESGTDISVAAAAEVSTAYRSARIESPRLADALVKAGGWLQSAAPARREIVVISPFRLDALREVDLASVPADVGLRFVPVGNAPASRELTGLTTMSAPRVEALTQSITLDGPRTRVDLTPARSTLDGLRIVGATGTDADALLRAVAIAGAPGPASSRPIVFVLGGGQRLSVAAVAALSPAAPRWMVPLALRLAQDEDLQRVARSAAAGAGPSLEVSNGWTTIASDREAKPAVQVAVAAGALAVRVASDARSFLAASALRAVLAADAASITYDSQEILRTPTDRLAAWSRPPQDVGRDAWRRSDRPDSRWLWLAALALLGVEQYLRRGTRDHEAEVRRAA